MSVKWRISELNKFRSRGFTFDTNVEANKVKSMDNEIRDISPVRVKGRADFGANKITFHLTIEGTMILPCSRTLVDVEYPFSIQTVETFALDNTTYADDDEMHELIGDTVDLMPIIYELILLEVPMQIISADKQGNGLAPQSGEGWELFTDEVKKEQIDPRLEKLKQFLKEK